MSAKEHEYQSPYSPLYRIALIVIPVGIVLAAALDWLSKI